MHVHGDLLRQVSVGHGDRHVGDVAHLVGQIARHGIHVVGEVLPGAGHAGHGRLTAQLAFRADLARHPGHFFGKRAELADHAVHDFGRLQELALERSSLDLERHGLRQIALRDRTDHTGHLVGGLDEIANQGVDGFNAGRPSAGGALKGCPLRNMSFLAHRDADLLELLDELLLAFEDLIQSIGNLTSHAGELHRHANGKVTLLEGRQDLQ